MEYKKKEFGSYNLHMIKTDRFKSVNMEIIFSDEIKKEEITKRNFLADMLTYSSKLYKTRHSLVIAMQDLYSAKFYASSYRIGNYYNTDFNLRFLDERYTEKGMLEKSIKFAIETILNPNVLDNSFDNDTFEVVKRDAKNQIEGIKENPIKYAIINMLNKMNSKARYSYHSFGYLEDLEKITEENLYEYYKEFIKRSNIDIYIIGNIDFEVVEKVISESLKVHVLKKPKCSAYIVHNNIKIRVKKYEEDDNTNQTKLSIGCKLKDLTEFEKNYASNIYSTILGGNSDSKLFKNVREKNSLCYSIYSSINKLDNLFLINSYITKANYNKVIKLIKQEMKAITEGNITDEELEKAKKSYIAMIEDIYDSPSLLIASYYAMDILNADEPETRKKMIMEVTKEDVINVSKKVYMDTIYLLGGDKENEED